jgi:O-succinylbenzoic acid--CoA ligase
MTETLSHIALRRLSGPDASDWYTPFPSVTVSLSDDSTLIINAPEVCPELLITNDIAELSTSHSQLSTLNSQLS